MSAPDILARTAAQAAAPGWRYLVGQLHLSTQWADFAEALHELEPQRRAAGAAAPMTVRVAMPQPLTATDAHAVPGRTEPAERAHVFTRATGIVRERRFDIGDRVEAGAVLADKRARLPLSYLFRTGGDEFAAVLETGSLPDAMRGGSFGSAASGWRWAGCSVAPGPA